MTVNKSRRHTPAAQWIVATTGVLTPMLLSPLAHGAVKYWDGASAEWNLAANWSTASGATTPDPATFVVAGDDAVFNISSVNGAETVTANAAIAANLLKFANTGTTAVQSNNTTARTLTLTGGITLNAGAGAVTIGQSNATIAVKVAASQSFTTNSSSLLQITNFLAGSQTLNTPTTLTFAGGGSGNITFNNSVTDGANGSPLALVVSLTGSGVLTNNVNNVSNYTGGTTIKSGQFNARATTVMNAGQGQITLGDTAANAANVVLNMTTGTGATGTGVNLVTASGTNGTITLALGNNTNTISGTTTLNNSGNLLLTQGSTNTLTFTNTISGVGGLTYTGAATTTTLALNANNTFANGVVLNSGTLAINAGGTNSTNSAIGTGTLTIAGGLLDNTSSPAAPVTLATNNAQVWNNNFTFTGTNALNLGTGNVSLGTVTGATRTVTVNASTLTVGGTIADGTNGTTPTKNLTVSGAGTLALNGLNTYTGATNVGTGSTLSVASLRDANLSSGVGASTNAAGNLQISNGATLRYTGAGNSTNRLFTLGSSVAANTGTIDASGDGTISFTNTSSPSYGSTAQTRTLILTGSNTGANTLNAAIANNTTAAVSVTKNGAGTWVLGGNASYTGATTVNLGTLLVNGTQTGASAYAVGDGTNAATLGGTGTIAGNVGVAASANVAPGSIGTPTASLAIGGTFVLPSNSTLNIDLAGTSFTLDGAEQYDRVKVAGLTTLGGTLSVSIGSLDLLDNQLFGIFDAVGGRGASVFSNYAEGALVAADATDELHITYLGNVTDGAVSKTGGSDVVLYTVAVPEPTGMAVLGLAGLAGLRRTRLSRA